jgi:TatD DNase family protein
VLIDSHVNLHASQFADDQGEVIARARAAGVARMVTICDRVINFPAVLAIAETHDDIWCTVGTHPHEAKDDQALTAQDLIQRASHDRVVGIGETGLDFYYNHSPRAPQIANFRAHIAAARELKLPLIVHTRDAEDETIEILRDEMGKGAFPGLIHCFTGTKNLAAAALDLGFCISVSGIATFKKSEDLRAVLKDVPLDRLLVETDAPYLAPMPHRGKRNEPAFVANTAAALAELKGVSIDRLARATTDNFFRLFTKASRPL